MQEVNNLNTGPEVKGPVLPADIEERLKTAVELKRQGIRGMDLVDAVNAKHGNRQVGRMDNPGGPARDIGNATNKQHEGAGH